VTSLRLRHLDLSVWPFGIIFVGEVLGAILIMRGSPDGRTLAFMAGQATAGAALGLLLAAVAIVLARMGIAHSWSARWRSVRAAFVVYVVIAIVSGGIMVVLLVADSDGSFPPALLLLYTVSRPVNIVILAIVVQQVRDGRWTSGQVNQILDEQLSLARRTNVMLETAERDLRVESRRLLEGEVARPLGDIVRDGAGLSDEELAGRLDVYISDRLRPLAHVLHPVSVRLGLIPAMRTLNPDLLVDATPMIERMDADGVLLDQEVRLQVYRWIRENLSATEPSRAALVMRERQLEVSVFPAGEQPLEAVQVAAGIRQSHPGVITVPLLGQSVEPVDLAAPEVTARPSRVRYRLRDLMTVPSPQRLPLVVMLSLAAVPFQFVVYRWPLSLGAIAASLGLSAAAIGAAALLGLLPAPQRTVAGAWRVLGEWVVIAVAAAVGLTLTAAAFGLVPLWSGDVFSASDGDVSYPIFRMLYRFAVPGLAVVISYGLVVTAHERLDLANAALREEEDRRSMILAESRRLDRDVAEALHRTVQGRLAAAVIMLRLGQRQDAWRQVVDMAVVEVPGLLERIGGVEHPGAPLIEAPPGLTIVYVGGSSRDDATFAMVQSALAEIASNARHHGQASTLTIRTEDLGDMSRVICEDDGVGPRGGDPGLGSRLLDDTVMRCGGAWRIEAAGSGSRVILELPREVSDRDFSVAGR